MRSRYDLSKHKLYHERIAQMALPKRFVPFLMLVMFWGVSACAPEDQLPAKPPALGDFSLGYNIVVVEDPEIGPLSRTATTAEWTEVLSAAMAERMGRYSGEKLYHLGIKVAGYALAKPGIPLVASPKSVLVITLTVWDDAAKARLNPEPENFYVFESLSGATVISSGLTQTKEVQMRNLSRNAARKVEDWLIKNRAWFEAAVPVSEPAERGPDGVPIAADQRDLTPSGAPARPTPPDVPVVTVTTLN